MALDSREDFLLFDGAVSEKNEFQRDLFRTPSRKIIKFPYIGNKFYFKLRKNLGSS